MKLFSTPHHKDDLLYMEAALQQAREAAAVGEVPVGAVLAYEGEIIAVAHNSVESAQNATLHAEQLVFSAGCRKLSTKYLTHCSLYVTLEPCAMCATASYWLQLREVIYGALDEKRGAHLWQPSLWHPKTTVRSGAYAAKSQILLQHFFQQLRQKKLISHLGSTKE